MDYRFFRIEKHETLPKAWNIYNKESGELIGAVEWYPRWRKLVLSPEYLTVWSIECLEDAANFIREETKKPKT